MSEDARGPKPRRILYVANPGSDEDSDDNGTPNFTNFSTQNPLRPNRQLQNSHHDQPSPVSTYLPRDPSSRPSLSSPSTSDSPAAEESTPPPSTPALVVPPVDLPTESQTSQEPAIAINTIDNPQTTTSRKGRFIRAIGAPFYPRRDKRPTESSPKRPRTSPTVSTPDSLNSVSSTSTISGKVLIVVTTDSDWYVTVDISGASNAAFVRECIFNKLNIQDDDQLRFSIYQTEMGAYAIGDALTDEKLFHLCRDFGDAKGSLKFFVSHTSAPVHEPPLRPHSPPITTIPPPVLPFNANNTPAPLRPKRRSRQESISSQSEQYPLETAGGYEADLENPDRETFKRPQPHPLPQPPEPAIPYANPANSPPSPHHSRRPNGLARPSSPHLRSSRPKTPPSQYETSRSEINSYDLRQFASLPPPQPLSPNRSNPLSEDNLTLPLTQRHGRTGSDAATQREQVPKTIDQYDLVAKQARSRQQHAIGGRLRAEPSKESLSPKDKRKRYPNVPEEVIGRSETWVVVPRANETEVSSPAPEPSNGIQPSRSGPRQQPQSAAPNWITSPWTGRSVVVPAAPRQPPPVPITNEARAPPPRAGAGVPIPSRIFAWKGEQRGDPKAVPQYTTSQWGSGRLAKGTKSMDNIRAAAYPAPLQPGSTRRPPPQLPIAARQTPPVPYAGYAPGVPKSYDPPRLGIRPLPVQGNAHNSNLDLTRDTYSRGTYSNTLMSPNQEPYPRPQSAFGDSMTSLTHQNQRLQSPTHGSVESGESGRSPRGISPNRPYHSTHLSGSKLDSSYGNRSDRSSDVQSGAETSYTTPPISPRSPLYPGRDMSSNSSRPSTSDSKANGSPEAHRTIRPEDHTWFSTYISQSSDGTLVPPRPSENKNEQRVETPPPSATSVVADPTYLNQFEPGSDGDDMGTVIWKKPPTAEAEKPKSILRPPLKVQIEASLGSGDEIKVADKQLQSVSQIPTPPSMPPPSPKPQKEIYGKRERGPRGSTFTDRQSSTWAPRPPPEDVYERLEEFFPGHDLDKPVIEANSGGTSPTTMTAEPTIPEPPVPPVPDKARIRGKKSIRIVAEEHKKLIDRTSRADASSYSNVLRKRSTKLWGSKLEEVTTAVPKYPPPSSSSSSNQAVPGPSTTATFKWVRGELIGRGTYGRVYLALNATTGEMIAVKQVELPRTASDKNDSRQVTVVQALKMESETLKDLDHPNIVQYLGFEQTLDNLSIFLEYVPGGSIGSCLLKHGKFEENVTKSFTGQILAGLEYLHSKGILHRDLKADNILVEMSGVCKISDFGISKRTDDSGGAVFTAMQGSVFWMAPEVISTKKKGYNSKIDIWSVGCVVLEMWAGSRPWNGDEVVAVMFKLYQSKQPPPIPKDVVLSELADDFRLKCFAINPEERPTAAELRKHGYLTLPPDWVFTDFRE